MKRIAVKPELLHWARDRAHLSDASLSKRFPKWHDWQNGDRHPTLKQLQAIADVTHTPIGYFFLDQPPVEQLPVPDFRTQADVHLGHPGANLLDTIYLCQQRQAWFRDWARTAGQAALPFVGTLRVGSDVATAADEIREALGFDLEERRALPTWADALRRFIEQADNLGILVMVSGVVGSNSHRRLDPREFRGFALSDDLAPLIFINGADSKAAQMFTLAHELVHIWLGQSAVSDATLEPEMPVRQSAPLAHSATERWCNAVAAELLVPVSRLADHYNGANPLGDELNRLARQFKVSTLVVLRRLHDSGYIDRATFWDAYSDELDRIRPASNSSGGDFYLTLGARVGKRFARTVISSAWEGGTSFTEAFRLLGVRKMATFEKFGAQLGVQV